MNIRDMLNLHSILIKVWGSRSGVWETILGVNLSGLMYGKFDSKPLIHIKQNSQATPFEWCATNYRYEVFINYSKSHLKTPHRLEKLFKLLFGKKINNGKSAISVLVVYTQRKNAMDRKRFDMQNSCLCEVRWLIPSPCVRYLRQIVFGNMYS